MKLLTFVFVIVISYCSYSQSDTLMIKLKNGKIEQIPILEFRSLQFDNVLFINDLKIKELSNYPNPFSDETTIEFEIESNDDVVISIFDINGSLINDFTCKNCPSGKNQFQWNTRNKNGELVPKGIYFYEIKSDKQTFAKKMIKVK